jgi:hypothetical protein
MEITRKQHVSKSGKSVLAFRQPVNGSAGVMPGEANGAQLETRSRLLGGPVVPIDMPGRSSLQGNNLTRGNL